jgi:glutamine cyclotransferase
MASWLTLGGSCVAAIGPQAAEEPESAGDDGVPVYSYLVLNTYPHDRNAFTQGLAFDDGILYEGTGRRGHSSLRQVDLETGVVQRLNELPERFFGEGMTVLGGRVIQLTWRSRVGFVYDKMDLALLREFTYPTEGWGITNDGIRLIMGDGTSILRFLDAETFEELGQIEVRDGTRPVTRLNELEYVNGEIYANIWKSDRIARIDPETGEVAGWIDLAGLLSPEDRSEPVDVLNGIAYDAEGDHLFVTGKLWPKLFEIELTLSR